MAKSRGESPVRQAFAPLSLRGAENARFTRNRLSNLKKVRQGEETVPGPGSEHLTVFPRPQWERTRVRVDGQPDMRQAQNHFY